MLAQQKKKYSDFYYKLEGVNDRIKVYKKLFNQSLPSYEQAFEAKK